MATRGDDTSQWHGLPELSLMDGDELLRERSVLPYHYVQTALAASFCLIWAFIGVTALIDRLGDARRQRDLHGYESATYQGRTTSQAHGAHRIQASKSRRTGASSRTRRRTQGQASANTPSNTIAPGV